MEKELSKLSLDDRNDEAQRLKDLLFKASSHDINVQLEGIKEVKSVASRKLNPPIDQLVASNIIPILVDCLKKGNEELALEATSTLATIASGSSEWAEKIVAAKAVPQLIELLSSPNESLREWVLRILDHMIVAGSESANQCLRQGVLDHVVKSVTPVSSSSFIEFVSLIVINSWKLKQKKPSMESLEKLLPVVSSLLTRNEVYTLCDSVDMISSLANAGYVDRIIKSGLIRQLVSFLSHDEDELKALTLHALGNIVIEDDEQTQAVLNEGVLNYLPELLLSKNEKIVKDALWVSSNITAGNRRQIQAVLDAGLIPSIIKALGEEPCENQKEAAWTVCNISQSGTAEQIMFLVDSGLIPSLCHLLTSTDSQLPVPALETIKNIIMWNDDLASVVKEIRRCGGFQSVQMLEEHGDNHISELALQIQEELSSEQIEEEEEADPMNFEENCSS